MSRLRRWRVRRAKRLLGLANLPIVECDRAGGVPMALLPIGTTVADRATIEAWLRDWHRGSTTPPQQAPS